MDRIPYQILKISKIPGIFFAHPIFSGEKLTIKSSSTIPADDLFGRAFMKNAGADNKNDRAFMKNGCDEC